MTRLRALVLVLLLAPEAARASDFSGMLSMLIGLPVLVVGVVVAVVFLALSPTRTRTRVAMVVLAPFLLAGLFLIPDLLTLTRYGDWMEIASYLVLLVVLAFLAIKILIRPVPADPG